MKMNDRPTCAKGIFDASHLPRDTSSNQILCYASISCPMTFFQITPFFSLTKEADWDQNCAAETRVSLLNVLLTSQHFELTE